jgi:hypothetical protein
LLKHSELYFWNTPDPNIVFISVQGDWAWRDLGEEGQRVQSRLLRVASSVVWRRPPPAAF